jgi:hypothetical protein
MKLNVIINKKVNGRMIKEMDKEFANIKMEILMKVYIIFKLIHINHNNKVNGRMIKELME